MLRYNHSDNCTYAGFKDINCFETKEEAEEVQLIFYEAGFKDTDYEWLSVEKLPESENPYLDACSMMRLDEGKFFDLWSKR